MDHIISIQCIYDTCLINVPHWSTEQSMLSRGVAFQAALTHDLT